MILLVFSFPSACYVSSTFSVSPSATEKKKKRNTLPMKIAVQSKNAISLCTASFTCHHSRLWVLPHIYDPARKVMPKTSISTHKNGRCASHICRLLLILEKGYCTFSNIMILFYLYLKELELTMKPLRDLFQILSISRNLLYDL